MCRNKIVFGTLTEAATFTDADFTRLLESAGLSLATLDRLTQEMGSSSGSNVDYENLTVFARPILKVPGKRIVLAPGELLAALRHSLICLATERGITAGLAQRFRRATWQAAIEHLKRLDIHAAGGLPQGDPDAPYLDGVFVLDADKALYMQLVADDFANYDCERAYGEWSYPSLVQRLEDRQRQVEAELFGAPDLAHPNECMTLILLQSVGRLMAIGLGKPLKPFQSPRIVLHVDDLDILSELEAGDPLVLWRFARASERFRDQTRVASADSFDEFATYRARRLQLLLFGSAAPSCHRLHRPRPGPNGF